MLQRLERPVIGAAIVFVLAFVVYQFTLAPSVGFIDSGELATVCATLGVAHPTGYPLFTLIGALFAHLHLAVTVIARLNQMSALLTALGAGTVVLLVHEILSHWLIRFAAPKPKQAISQSKPAKGQKPNTAHAIVDSRPDRAIGSVSIATGFVAAFSRTWWSQSTGLEVYPLHLPLITLSVYFFLRWLREERRILGVLFAVLLGLAFTNHLTTILLAPGLLYLYFRTRGLNRAAFARLLPLLLPFAAALSLYAYLPITSAQGPIMDWGHPANWDGFIKHVTGGQYKVWMFTGSGAAAKNWSYFWTTLLPEFGYLGGVLAIVGVVGLFRSRAFRMLTALLLLFFGCLFYAINYDIHDIDSYFLLAYLTTSLLIGIAAYWLLGRLTQANPQLSPSRVRMASLAVFVLPLLQLTLNYKSVDESGNYMVEDFTRNMLTNLPPNAIVYSSQWDFWVSGSFYYQLVEHLRPDVLVIDKALLRDRPWYYAYLIARAPEVVKKAEGELHEFLRHLVPFDRGDPYDQGAIGPAYSRFSSALVRRNLDRPTYITSEVLTERDELFAPGMTPHAAGLAFRYMSTDTSSVGSEGLASPSVPKLQWRDANYKRRNYLTDNARYLQALPLAATAERLVREGNAERASQFVKLALIFKPDAGVELGDLSPKDREFAEYVDGRFAAIEQLKHQIDAAMMR